MLKISFCIIFYTDNPKTLLWLENIQNGIFSSPVEIWTWFSGRKIEILVFSIRICRQARVSLLRDMVRIELQVHIENQYANRFLKWDDKTVRQWGDWTHYLHGCGEGLRWKRYFILILIKYLRPPSLLPLNLFLYW